MYEDTSTILKDPERSLSILNIFREKRLLYTVLGMSPGYKHYSYTLLIQSLFLHLLVVLKTAVKSTLGSACKIRSM